MEGDAFPPEEEEAYDRRREYADSPQDNGITLGGRGFYSKNMQRF